MRYIKDPSNYEESKIELQNFIGYYTSNERFFLLWAIEAKDDGKMVGICGVYHNSDKENEIAYRLREKYWGKSIGSEIAIALISHCLTKMNMSELVAFADELNVGSVKILEQTMKFEMRFFDEKRERYTNKYILFKNKS
jgi:ribosomal-protein-alanine N-acetyltransferase